MHEVVFLIEEAGEGDHNASAMGESIFTESNIWKEIKRNSKEAMECNFEKYRKPKLICLNYAK